MAYGLITRIAMLSKVSPSLLARKESRTEEAKLAWGAMFVCQAQPLSLRPRRCTEEEVSR